MLYSIRLRADQIIWSRSNICPVSQISTLQLWWNLISVVTDELFQHFKFHGGCGWWNFMITKGTWLWHWPPDFAIQLTLRSLKLQKILSYVNQWSFGCVCSSSRSKMCEKSHLWYPLKSPLLLFSLLETSSQSSYLLFRHEALFLYHFSEPQTLTDFSAHKVEPEEELSYLFLDRTTLSCASSLERKYSQLILPGHILPMFLRPSTTSPLSSPTAVRSLTASSSPSTTSTTAASSARTSSGPSTLSLLWPRWQTRDHLLPLQGPWQRHCHRRLWHTRPPSIPHSCAHPPQPESPRIARRAAHLPRWLFRLRRPRNPQKHRPRNTRQHLGHRFLCTHKQIHLVCTSHHHLHAPLRLPPLSCRQHDHPRPASPDHKIEFQSPCWNLVSNQAKSFIRRLAALDQLHFPTADEALCDPWLANTPSHVDITPTLRQNWSPRAKWCSVGTRVRATNRFAAAATTSRSSTQSSGEWHKG